MNERDEVRVWDPLVRTSHWLLAAAFLAAYLSGDDRSSIHHWAGYTAFVIVGLRILWVFVGTRYARFANFVRTPTQAMAYTVGVLQGRSARHIGHNPAGALMIVVLLTMVAAVALTGMATLGAEHGSGPLAALMAGSPHWVEEALEETHEFLANATLALVAVHVAGVVVESFLHSENLIKAMLTGRKQRHP